MERMQGSVDEIVRLLEPEPSLAERVVADDVCWKGKIFSADVLEVELPDGTRGVREVAWHRGGCGVCALKEGRICLVRQWRVAFGRMALEIPAGKLEEGERPEDCAARELLEETGLVADRLVPIACSAGSIGFTSETTRIFKAEGLAQAPAHPDPDEFVDTVWLPLEDVLAGIASGLIQDSKTIIAAQALALEELRK